MRTSGNSGWVIGEARTGDATPLMLPLLLLHSSVWGHEVVGMRRSGPDLNNELGALESQTA